jgi:hypothetical protein
MTVIFAPSVRVIFTEVMTLRGTFLSVAEINTKINISSRRDAVGVVPYKEKINYDLSKLRGKLSFPGVFLVYAFDFFAFFAS